MSSTFTCSRFLRLTMAHWIENKRRYLWFIGISLIVDVIFILIFFSSEQADRVSGFSFGAQAPWYTIGLFLTGSVFAGLHFKDLSRQGASLVYLMRPASVFEKWSLTLLVCAVFFPLIYTFFFVLLAFPAVITAEAMRDATTICAGCLHEPGDFRLFLPFLYGDNPDAQADFASENLRIQLYILLLFWSVEAVILCGCAFYRKAPILKTVVTMFLFLLLTIFIGIQPELGAFWGPSDGRLIPYSSAEIALSGFFWVSLPTLLWVTVYFLLREREVA